MNLSETLSKVLWASLCYASLATVASAAELVHDYTVVKLTGKVIGPITKGPLGEGVEIKAFYLQLDKPIDITDDSSCGHVTAKMLPIFSDNIKQFKNKKVEMTALIACHTERLGSYALQDVVVKELK